MLLLAIIIPMTLNAVTYYSENFDYKTVAAMAGAYGTGAATEAYYSQQIKKILEHYQGAEIATAGILASKYLDRKALTNIGILGSPTENYYYRRIYGMVSGKIIPKIWTVAGMMMRNPDNAIYWGPYLVKICNDTETLCKQFETVVCNGKLTFKDIAFLKVKDEVVQIFNLSNLGSTDFRKIFDDIAKGGQNITLDNLKADADRLYEMGVGLASSGFTNLSENLLQKSSFHNLFQGKYGEITNLVTHYGEMFDNAETTIGNTLKSIMDNGAVENLFNLDNYSTTAWITDYARESMGQYYTQRYYIYKGSSGNETLCNYIPGNTSNIINGSGEWYKIQTNDKYYVPTPAETEAILCNSENYAGWSRSRVKSLQDSNDGYTYQITYYRGDYNIWSGNKNNLLAKAYAYEITVTRSWQWKTEVHEATFDSYSMDQATFMKQLQVRRDDLNHNGDGATYYIASDEKHYYQASDARKMAGVESAMISVTCHDGSTLGEGTAQYKCSDCGGAVNAHTKSCVMSTTLATGSFNTTELDGKLSDIQNKITEHQSEIARLEQENKDLIRQIAVSSIEEAAALRQTANVNNDRIEKLKEELVSFTKQADDLQKAKSEALEGENVQTDDYHRLPAIMQECQHAYRLSWNDDGHWEGNTYVRTATIPGINGVVTFKAVVSIARKPKYFLGVKIHRAIVQIDWKLTTEYSDTQVVDVIELDPSQSDEQKADQVNARIRDIAVQYPTCDVTVEYARNKPSEEDSTGDTPHLLWASDRLDMAREIDSRITRIYADLVSLEKMMSYKLNILNVLGQYIVINYDQDRRMSIIQQCHRRWMSSAALRRKENDK